MKIFKGQLILVLLLAAMVLPGLGCGRRAPEPPAFQKSGERGPVSWQVMATRTSLSTAEELVLEERITTPDAATAAWQELPAALTEKFTIVVPPPTSRPESAGRLSRDRRLRLFPKQPGTIEIPERQVKISGGGIPEQILELPKFTITVASVVKDAKPLPLPDPLTMRSGRKLSWLWIGVAVVLALLAAIVVIWLWRRQPPPPMLPPLPPVPSVPPVDEALAALARLEASGLAAAGHFKEFYLELTIILRRYLERRFGVAALERTTDEFMAETRGDPRFAGAEFQVLPGLLAAADLVKFAEARPTADTAIAALAACRQFVEATRPPPGPVPPPIPAAAGGAS